MDRRTFLHHSLGAGAALALASCSRLKPGADAPAINPAPVIGPDNLAPTARRTLRIAGGDIGLPTPFAYSNPSGYFTMLYFYDTLMYRDATGEQIPWLASGYERSPDGLTYTFQLRQNAKWHDGRPFTAEDVVFTYDYFKANDAAMGFFVQGKPPPYMQVKVTAAGPHTVQFRLDRPYQTFLHYAAGRVPIIPKHIWSGVKDPRENDKALLIGTGPYKLAAYEPTQASYLLEANDEFFAGPPFYKRIERRRVADELAALAAGDIDAILATDVSRSALGPFLRKQEEFGIQAGQPDTLYALYFNCAKEGPLSDVRFRQACAKAIDRRAIVRSVAGGNGEVGNPGWLAKAHPYRVEVEQYNFDRTVANKMLDDAGYKKGKGGIRQTADGTPLRFKLASLPATASLTEFVAQSLKEVGIQTEIDPTDLIFLTMGQADFEMGIAIFGGIQEDPDELRRTFSERPSLTGAKGYVNPELDKLADQQLVTADEMERKRIVAEMQRIVARDLPLLHLYYPVPYAIYRKKVVDQVKLTRLGGSPLSKPVLVTGTSKGGLEIRPTTP